MKTEPNSPITPTLLRQITESEFKIASEKDSREGIYLKSEFGLTKREYFAAMAMQGLSAGVFSNERVAIKLLELSDEGDINPQKYIAGMALEIADALIEELNKSKV